MYVVSAINAILINNKYENAYIIFSLLNNRRGYVSVTFLSDENFHTCKSICAWGLFFVFELGIYLLAIFTKGLKSR